MSFILDALKKSENERQQQVPAEFSTVPANADSTPVPRWLWVLGALLIINVVAVAALVMRDDTPPPAVVAPVAVPASTTAAPEPRLATEAATPAQRFEDRLEEARRQLPERAAASPQPSDVTSADIVENSRRATSSSPPQSTNTALLPTANELRLRGEIELPQLHVDLHVFGDQPQDRFVFINTNKYREGDRMSEGPVVEQITHDGVVLDYRGRRFLLSRD